MTAPRFTAQGKQVIRDGEHYADACNDRAAELIAAAMNRQSVLIDDITERLMAFDAEDLKGTPSPAATREGGE